VNTKTPAVRLILALAALLMTPFGCRVLGAALSEPSPHLMVMLVFSGSLAALTGLAAAVGLIASFRQAPEPHNPSKEKKC
jgi:hypothetical protein